MTKQLKSNGKEGYVASIICILGVSSSPLFYKFAFNSELHALWINVFRLFATALIMLAIAFINPKNRAAILQTSKKNFWTSALAGTLLALHLNGWAMALSYTEAFAASTILGTYVLWTVLFASLIIKEKTSKGALIGLVVATVGVVVCNFGGGVGRLSGNMFALFAAITEALYVLCGRKARAEMGAVAYTTIMYSFTFLWMLIMALFVDLPADGVPLKGVFWAVMLAIFSTLLGHSMASVALKYFKAASVSAMMMSGVISGPMLVLLVLGETPTIFTIIGGTIIVTGLILYMMQEWREAKRLAARNHIEAEAQ